MAHAGPGHRDARRVLDAYWQHLSDAEHRPAQFAAAHHSSLQAAPGRGAAPASPEVGKLLRQIPQLAGIHHQAGQAAQRAQLGGKGVGGKGALVHKYQLAQAGGGDEAGGGCNDCLCACQACEVGAQPGAGGQAPAALQSSQARQLLQPSAAQRLAGPLPIGGRSSHRVRRCRRVRAVSALSSCAAATSVCREMLSSCSCGTWASSAGGATQDTLSRAAAGCTWRPTAGSSSCRWQSPLRHSSSTSSWGDSGLRRQGRAGQGLAGAHGVWCVCWGQGAAAEAGQGGSLEQRARLQGV